MSSKRATRAVLAVLMSVLTGCGHFRHQSNGFNSNGTFRTASDYGITNADNHPAVKSEPDTGPFKLAWPVGRVRLNRGFNTSGRVHLGLDLGGTSGTPIQSAHNGTVIYAGRDFRGFGNMVLVEFNDEWASLYGHLSHISVREGQRLQIGDEVGRMGMSGRASGVHLHFELMRHRQPVDPITFLNGSLAGR